MASVLVSMSAAKKYEGLDELISSSGDLDDVKSKLTWLDGILVG